MLIDALAVVGLVALVLVWLATQKLGARHGAPAAGALRCGACSGDCGNRRPDCPRFRLSEPSGKDEPDSPQGSAGVSRGELR